MCAKGRIGFNQADQAAYTPEASRPTQLAQQFEQYNLLVPELLRVCINRVRLLSYGYSENTGIPVPDVSGTLINPVAMALELA
ncbi:hypothetical protein [Deminuibacter soli]|uniref:Uncharacterized protein n=1 Tax=Deminuibacter soli TaxID=2291815 RepID=A0A3E1NHL7_9BACT|nr:hypothetical protein [Deminuibacter soli]RFM27446.1 hypothetical protein DXN05_15625 [Deminuibacter soli]